MTPRFEILNWTARTLTWYRDHVCRYNPVYLLVFLAIGLSIFTQSHIHQICSWLYILNKDQYREGRFKVSQARIVKTGSRGSRRLLLFGTIDRTDVCQSVGALSLSNELIRKLNDGNGLPIERDVLFAKNQLGRFKFSGVDFSILDISYRSMSWLKLIVQSLLLNVPLIVGVVWLLLFLKPLCWFKR